MMQWMFDVYEVSYHILSWIHQIGDPAFDLWGISRVPLITLGMEAIP